MPGLGDSPGSDIGQYRLLPGVDSASGHSNCCPLLQPYWELGTADDLSTRRSTLVGGAEHCAGDHFPGPPQLAAQFA